MGGALWLGLTSGWECGEQDSETGSSPTSEGLSTGSSSVLFILNPFPHSRLTPAV